METPQCSGGSSIRILEMFEMLNDFDSQNDDGEWAHEPAVCHIIRHAM